jgi:eukaryotic-like serine/threonine-protein kinase
MISVRTTRRQALGLVVLLAAVGAMGWLGHRFVAQTTQRRVGDELTGTLAIAVGELQAWLDETLRIAEAAASDPAVVETASHLPAGGDPPTPGAQDSSLPAPWVASSRALFPYLHAGGFDGVAVIDADGGALDHSRGRLARDQLTRPGSPLRLRLEREMAAWAKAPAGADRRPVFVPPLHLPGRRAATFVVAPMPGTRGAATRALVFEVPNARFTRVLHGARIGDSGETYAFDEQGRMLSNSRFPDQLRRAGLLSRTDDSAALVLALRDPGGDLTRGSGSLLPPRDRPLTVAVRHAVGSRAPGSDARGYRDYRGVQVVGAWTWLPRFGFGVVTEADVAEAYGSLSRLREFVMALMLAIGGAGLALILSAMMMGRTRERLRQAQQVVLACGQYRIQRLVGQGGMGAVYLATHATLRRPTAIKLLRPDRLDPELVARFAQEARATSELCHPNTVAVYDYGKTEEGVLFYAMEYLEGLNLERLVQRHGPLPEARIIHILRQACGALAEAHSRGLVHRDLKPSNLLLCHRGGVPDLVKVLDFGLARWFRRDSLMTHSPGPLGTPGFMAPELFDGGDQAGPRTDIYALGAVGYVLLTGAAVFEADSLAALCAAHVARRPVPPSQRLGRAVDPVLERVILSCLAKSPEGRPGGATALRWLLDSSAEAGQWTEARALEWWTSHGAEESASAAKPAAPDADGQAPVRAPGGVIRPSSLVG